MRRPLADAGLFFIFIIVLIQLLKGISYPDLSRWESQQVSIEGTLTRIEHKEKGNAVTSILYLNEISGAFTLPNSQDIICCHVSDLPYKIRLGSRISICGTLHVFEPAYNPGNFDSLKYNAVMNISASVSGAHVTGLIQESDSPYRKVCDSLCDIRHIISKLCDVTFIEADSSVAKAMLTGDKSSLSDDLKNLYSQNGIAHILAISGLHISLIGGVIYKVLRKLGIPIALCSVISVIIMISYGIICGMAASAVRAIIMFTLRMLSNLMHRTFDMPTALVVSAALILINHPKYIYYSGFLFSFGAIIGIIAVWPSLINLFHKYIGAGLSVNLATLPIHLYNYFYFPVFSVLMNLYIIPLMSVLIILMLIALLLSIVYLPLGRLLAYPVHLILLIYEYSCKIGNLLPFGKFVTGQPSVSQIIIYYIMLTTICLLSKKLARGLIYPLLIICCIILSLNLNTGLTMTAIDVGQGDSILLSDSRNISVLIDAGSSSVEKVGTYRISPYLLSQGIDRLDAVFITHMDSDHYNALSTLIEESGTSSPKIDTIYFSSVTKAANSADYNSICKQAKNKNIQVRTIYQGEVLQKGNLYLYCLYPDTSCTGQNINAESLVLYALYKNAGIMLTGDLEGEGETALNEILTNNKLISETKFRILKTAHHGSKNSTYETFLDLYKPDLAIISAGRNNSYNHPHAELLDRLISKNIPFYTTRDYGAISIKIHANSVNVIGYTRN